VRPKNHLRALTVANACALGAIVLVSSLLAGCGGGGAGATGAAATGGKQPAASFIRRVTTEFSLGQSGRLWDALHPSDQAVVTRARYVACQSNSGFDLKKLVVLDTYADRVDVAGVTTPATAISLRTTSDDGVTTATVHAVLVKGTWRWVLSSADYAAYSHGKCPASASS
jgi:hypothetical protein